MTFLTLFGKSFAIIILALALTCHLSKVVELIRKLLDLRRKLLDHGGQFLDSLIVRLLQYRFVQDLAVRRSVLATFRELSLLVCLISELIFLLEQKPLELLLVFVGFRSLEARLLACD